MNGKVSYCTIHVKLFYKPYPFAAWRDRDGIGETDYKPQD